MRIDEAVIAAKRGTARANTRAPRRIGALAAPLLLVVTLGACSEFLDDLVDVSAPDRIVAETYESPENVSTLMAGAVGDFECALAHFISAAGIASDELMITDALTAPELLDKRQWDTHGLGAAWAVSTCNGRSEGTPGLYRPVATARWQADNLLRLLEGWTDAEVPNRSAAIAKAAAYAGYGLVLLGETMCEAPLDIGAARSSTELLTEAEDRFTRAIAAAQASGATEFLNMARVGLARARLNLGDLDGAAEVAADVPAGFVKYANYSTSSARRYNVIFLDVQGNAITVGPPYREVTFGGVADPRVPVFDTGRVQAGVNIPLWDQSKYDSRSTPIAIASYEEARLIVAEAAVASGDVAGAVAIINELHAAAGLPAFSSADADEVMQHVIEERAAELFLEGQRFGDIRRYSLPLVPTPGTPYHTGGAYTDARCFPIPGIESDANPNV